MTFISGLSSKQIHKSPLIRFCVSASIFKFTLVLEAFFFFPSIIPPFLIPLKYIYTKQITDFFTRKF